MLLNDAPPCPTCSRSITAKPPLSQSSAISLWPVITELSSSELSIRYEPSPTNANTSPRERAMLAPQAPASS